MRTKIMAAAAAGLLGLIGGTVVASAGTSAKPYRDPIRSPVGAVGDRHSFILPDSKNGCSFAMGVEAEVIGVYWLFSDGHEVEVNIATITLTNLDTGTSYVQTSDYRISAAVAVDGIDVVIDGNRWMGFLEGDQGPEGEVGRGGAEYFVTGNQSFVYDPKKAVHMSYELNGQAIDACEVLA
jgi:hypothetical protein